MSEQKEILHWKAKKVRMGDEKNWLSDEFYDVLYDIYTIIQKTGERYIDLNKYEIETYHDANVYNEGTAAEFCAQRADIYLVNKTTKDREWIGSVEFADNSWDSIPNEQEHNKDYVLVYSSKDIRQDVEEIFRDWAKEQEEAEEDE
jgi:hypothetical protein